MFREVLLVPNGKGDFSGYSSSDDWDGPSSSSDSLSDEEVSRINLALTSKEFFQTPYKMKKEYRNRVLQKLLDGKKEEKSLKRSFWRSR